jgi:hypothetical protein
VRVRLAPQTCRLKEEAVLSNNKYMKNLKESSIELQGCSVAFAMPIHGQTEPYTFETAKQFPQDSWFIKIGPEFAATKKPQDGTAICTVN